MFKDLRIKKRLTISFIIVSIIASISGIVGGVAMFYIAGEYDYALQNYGFSQGDIGKALVTFADSRSATKTVIAYTDADIIETAFKTHGEKRTACQAYMETVKQTITSPKEEELYNAALSSMEKYWKLDDELLELGNTTDVQRSAEAQARAAAELNIFYDEAYKSLSELMNLNVSIGNEMQGSLAVLRNIL